MRPMRRVMAGLWWVVVLGVCCVWGQEGVFEIRVTLSKGQANFDADLGIGAEMRNVSGERMRVYEEDMVLVGPPEMGGGGDCVVWGLAGRSVTVPAGEAVSAFWDLRGMGCGGGSGINCRRRSSKEDSRCSIQWRLFSALPEESAIWGEGDRCPEGSRLWRSS
jgi:hypothetical protein